MPIIIPQPRLRLLPLLFFLLLVLLPLRANATEDERRAIPVESNSIQDWPLGPVTGAKSAVLREVHADVLLYEKDMHRRLYPASTTKLMTCLVAIENASLTDTVTVSRNAVNLVPPDGSRIGMNPGESVTLEEALYGIMVGSANEVSNAVAEHVAGSIEAFADLMNERAAALGCTDTHFTNPNGLHDPEHYTSAYDLSLIAEAFFDSVTLSEIGGTPSYHFAATPTQPDDFTLRNKHRLITGDVYVEGVIGGKTGFTDEAGECLVTCAERDGLRLISVVLFESSPTQFTDSQALLEYGFSNFTSLSLTGREESILPAMPDFFLPDRSLFGKSVRSVSFAQGSFIVLPTGRELRDTELLVSYPQEEEKHFASLDYSFHGAFLGRADLIPVQSSPVRTALLTRPERPVYYILLPRLLLLVTGAALFLTVLMQAGTLVFSLLFGKRARRRRRRQQAKRRRKI